MIDVQAGQEFQADFRLRLQRGYRVSGTITGLPAGLPVSLWLMNRYGQQIHGSIGVDAKSGRWQAGVLPPGDWTMGAQANDAQGRRYSARQEIAVGESDLNNVEIAMHPSISIPVTINHSAGVKGNAYVNATLFPTGEWNQRTFSLAIQGATPPEGRVFLAPGTVGPATNGATQNSGENPLAFENIEEGKYRLDVFPNPPECLDSAWYGNVDLSRSDLVVNGAGGQRITINMRNDCSTLGIKLDGAGFTIVVSDDNLMSPRVLQNFRGNLLLSPGKYRVYALTDINDLEYANPEALRDYPAEEVELDPNQKLELSLKAVERKGN
jgi:hypothetical protein